MSARIAILASGGGTTAEAFIRARQRGDISTDVGLIICSRRDAGVFDRIKNLNKEFGLHIPVVLINSQTHPPTPEEHLNRGEQSKAEENAILTSLQDGHYDLIVQMGYMKKSGPRIVHEFGWRPDFHSIYEAKMLNTHPGLLPESKGLYGEFVQQYVLQNHLPHSGQTLHVVAEKYDEGPTIAVHKVPVENGDTPDRLFARIQAIEKQYLPTDLERFIREQQVYNKQHKGV